MVQKKRKRTKHKQQARRKTKKSGTLNSPAWLMFVTGLGLGLFVAALIFLNANEDLNLGSGLKSLLQPRASAAKDAGTIKRPQQATALPKLAQPKFDFYTVLPEIESVLPNGTQEYLPNQNSADKDINYVLQAASYARFTDARKLKDKLWRNGLTARIEKISIEHRGAYYRVRLGPYDRLDNLDRDNKKLVTLGIYAMRLKIAKHR
jgi:cell division protein FtsN